MFYTCRHSNQVGMEKEIKELMMKDAYETGKGHGNGMVSGKQSDTIHYCDLCGVNVHRSYLKNHLYSKVHRSKLKENGTLPDLTLKQQKYCLPCDTVFTNGDFYEAHKGSKTHKRNAKTYPDQLWDTSGTAAIFGGGAFSPRAMRISMPTLKDQVEEDRFIRKKYKTRPDQVESTYRHYYIQTLTAFLSLRLALYTNIKDFHISVNDRKWRTFGDIVIDVTTNKNKNTVYAIKCKQVSDTEKQIDSLSQAKIIMNKEYESLTSLKKIQEFDVAKFLIFTNDTASSKFSSTESENTVEISGGTLNLWKTEKGTVPESDTLLVKPSRRWRSDLIDVTSDPENVFSINPKVENESYELPFVFFYTSQKVNPLMVDELLRKTFEKSIYQQYSKYIEKWAEGDLGGHYYLNKRDVILKIGEILLSPYTMLPKKIHSKNDDFDIWNQVISQVDLTIVTKENHITSKICQPINQIIDKILVKIDEISRSVKITKEIVNAITDPAIRAYLFEEYNTPDKKSNNPDKTIEIPINKIYNIFWKSGKIPLLLVSEKKNENDFILEVIYFMKQYGVNRKFLLKSSQPLCDTRLRIFTCLDDVKDLVNLENIGYTFPGGHLSLKTISSSDPFFLKWITPNWFFEMALGRYKIQRYNNNNNEQLDDLKMILDDETKNKLLANLIKVDDDGSKKGIENKGRLKGVNPLWF